MDNRHPIGNAKKRKRSNDSQPETASSGLPQIIITDGPKEPIDTSYPAKSPRINGEDAPGSLPSSRGSHDSDYPPRRSESAGAGFVVPSSIKYTLVTNLGPSTTQHNDLQISLHDPNSYHQIEEEARDRVKDAHAKEIGEKDLLFRYGNCTLVGERKFRSRLPLTSPEEWVDIYKAILKYQAANGSGSLRLIVLREYALYQYRATKDLSLIAAKSLEIHDLMKRAWARSNGKPYIPHTDLKKVIPPSMLPELINEGLTQGINADEREALMQQLQSKGMILLAMFVYANNHNPLDCLRELLDKGYCDEKLSHQPLSEDDICHNRCKKGFDTLIEKQGGYIAAHFNKRGEHQVFLDHIVIPVHYCPTDEDSDGSDSEIAHEGRDKNKVVHAGQIDKQGAFCGEGAYSKVYRVRLDPNHHKLAPDKDTYFALKEFRSRPDKVSDFEKELKILNELRKYGHPHIVTHLATWTQDEAYFMLFPYAKCNLRQYMRKRKFRKREEDIMWFLEQLQGLASALKMIHDLTNEEDLAEPLSPMLHPPSPVLSGERRSGWHHDLKPENILYFWHTDPPRGCFRISDWGSGKVNTYRSGRTSIDTLSPTGTPTYEPPEVMVEGRTSRPYDVWSLGCVFLELLVWALFDFEAVNKFKDERFGRRDLSTLSRGDDAFWQKDESQSVVLRKAVHAWILRLEDKVKLLQRPKAFQAVIDLIKAMLNINSERRIKALDVEDTLSRICKSTRVEFEDSDPAATDKDPAIPRLSLKAPENSPRVTILNSRSVSPAYATFVSSSPNDIQSGRSLHSRDTSVIDALSPNRVPRSRNTSNASSTISFRDAKTGPSKASSPEPAEELNPSGQS